MATQFKEILVREGAGLERRREPVRVSVPFARGELADPQGVGLADPQGTPLPVQLQALSRWKDGSVQWLLCDFQATVPPGESTFRLAPDAERGAAEGVKVVPGEGAWEVDTGPAQFTLDVKELRPFFSVRVHGKERVGSPRNLSSLRLADGSPLTGSIESVALECPGPLRATLCLRGSFAAASLFTLRLTFFAGKSLCLTDLTLHNPRAARHEGGRWDLGDPGSLFFSELSLWLGFADGVLSGVTVVAGENAEPLRSASPSQPFCIRQESSGGNWRLSPNHLAAGGRLACTAAGYRVEGGDKTLLTGDRALPSVCCSLGEGGVGAFLPRFWQEFPKAIEGGGNYLKVSFFPAGMPEPYELQGGERKNSTLWLDFDAREGGLDWLRAPLAALAAPEEIRRSNVFPDLPPGGAGEDLVDRFLPSPERLFARREAIDEYGWRHFGELYADHEAVYHQGDEPFVSHYNNQYDVLAGLYRKFLATGDPRWGELASDLARHVLDIDIYHTYEDREEYNGGLFWHTDHYISAGLATHRTFSAVHLGVKDPRFFGGGPGAEHCYTSGLLLHYYLTGEPEFRDAVLSLADWVYCSLTGPRLVLATLKKSLRYLSRLREAKGSLFPRYPLTRGTGNALTACLDAFQLSGDRCYLARGEELIRGALHPLDDIEARDLGNPEAAWSYTVLLGAVAKYLDKKSELQERDEAFALARGGLLAYADWMEGNEYPYLRKTELLEYPNETWAAQELRKCVVLYHAARYAPPERRLAYLEKARLLLEAALEDLERFATSSCTRPVALMLQNGWIAAALDRELPAHPTGDETACLVGAATPRLSGGTVVARVLRELGDALRETTLKRELAWLKSRLG